VREAESCRRPSGALADAHSAAAAVSPERLGELLARSRRCGDTGDGGVRRLALDDQDFLARRLVIDRGQELALAPFRDDAGNVFLRRSGRRDGAPVTTGSHTDSQPAGGHLDGMFGICAALEVVAALDDAGVMTERPLEVAIWTNEEGCRFAPGSMGAAAFVNPDRLAGFRDVRDADGIGFGQELDRWAEVAADVPTRPLAAPMHAFLEAHIEQGPRLERAGVPVGAVSGIQGVRWLELLVEGASAHAGTTPAAARRDALRAAHRVLGTIYALADADDDDLRVTVGRFHVQPGAINSVPGSVRLTVDARHPDATALTKLADELAELNGASVDGCRVSCTPLMHEPPTPFHASVLSIVKDAIAVVGTASVTLVSGAFHDSMHLARHCPTGMIFAPSTGGISHHPAEATPLSDLTTTTRVLAAALVLAASQTRV
jgi:N-carbamoyl-L-amino-acid hydrolase